jgi:hypothetical protein
MPNELELSIYRTLAYFAHFKYPLSAFEIWKWLLQPGRPVALAEIFETLTTSTWLKTRLEQRQGFYALGEVEVWVKDRQLRFLDAMRKFAKIERAVQLLGRLPWLEGVAVCNSLAWYQTTETSDIDLFILAKSGRVWSARLLSTLPFLLLRQRPGEGRPDPVCLSFFCASSSLNLETLKIKEFDPYLAYWSLSLVPLVERRDVFKQFALANTWLAELLPNAYGVSRAERFRPVTPGAVRWLPLSNVWLSKCSWSGSHRPFANS